MSKIMINGNIFGSDTFNAEDISFNNTEKGQLTSTNVQDAIDEISDDITIIDNKVNELNSNLSNFQNGVDTIVNGCTTYGSTPTDNTPSAIINSIGQIYTNRYNNGYTEGKASVTPKIAALGITYRSSSSSPGTYNNTCYGDGVNVNASTSANVLSFTILKAGRYNLCVRPGCGGDHSKSNGYILVNGTYIMSGKQTYNIQYNGDFDLPAGAVIKVAQDTGPSRAALACAISTPS